MNLSEKSSQSLKPDKMNDSPDQTGQISDCITNIIQNNQISPENKVRRNQYILTSQKTTEKESTSINKVPKTVNESFMKPSKKVSKGFVGFSYVLNQRERRQKQKTLRLIVLGEKGVGKTTFIKSILHDSIEETTKLEDFTQYRSKLDNLTVIATEFRGTYLSD